MLVQPKVLLCMGKSTSVGIALHLLGTQRVQQETRVASTDCLANKDNVCFGASTKGTRQRLVTKRVTFDYTFEPSTTINRLFRD